MNFQTMSQQRKFLLITAAIGVISVFLPWYTVLGTSISGFRGLGLLVFLIFAGVGVVACLGDQTKPLEKTMWIITLGAGALAVLIMLFRLTAGGDAFGVVQRGFGLFISLAATLGIVAFAWMYKNPGDTIQSGFDSLKNGISANTTPAKPTSGVSKVDELEKLIELKNQGKISDEEYQLLKSKII